MIELTEVDLDAFCRLSGDYSTIHCDDEYAQGRGFRQRIAHGLLVGARLSEFIGMTLPGKHGLLQSMNCQFRGPCYVPNILTIVGTVTGRSEALCIVMIHLSVTDSVGTEIVTADAKSVLKF